MLNLISGMPKDVKTKIRNDLPSGREDYSHG
jgi:hypothetical protein